ncbi:MAG: hypothetical protein HETSPECPRED_002716 [Heterodermia speciosa]|uniref:Defect at low temperature protein 1 n=1 Tax=Heterodermia speciosa TaxID=116794 RepID=A0A8H3F849_9LECA|nr:MAG: hypothetical protein HETSPECPRED_002716 [Heterodermia speciosa]
MHVPFFRIFYSTTFTLLTLLLTALLLITPGDHIYQAFLKSQVYNIFIVAAAYLLTLLIATFIYAGRQYTNRSVLAAVPRELGLFENGKGTGVPRCVRRLVREGLERSAWIGWTARPKDIKGATGNSSKYEDAQIWKDAAAKRKAPGQSPLTGEKPPDPGNADPAQTPVWGTISYPGWSSPDSTDLPNIHLAPIILELPHLIEAKAVSLAPLSATISQHHNPTAKSNLPIPPPESEQQDPSVRSPLATSLLQRPATMGLRSYLTHLSSLSLIHPPHLATIFLSAYERARFSGTEITEPDFRALMGIFAEILRGMTALPPEILSEIQAEEGEFNLDGHYSADENGDREGEWLDGAPPPRSSLETTSTVAHTPLPLPPISSSSSSTSSRSRPRGLRTPSIPSIRDRPAARSLRSQASSVFTSRSSARSVIRLAPEGAMLDLPYVIDGVEGG